MFPRPRILETYFGDLAPTEAAKRPVKGRTSDLLAAAKIRDRRDTPRRRGRLPPLSGSRKYRD